MLTFMPRKRFVPTLPALAVALALLSPALSAAAPPDFSGTWVFVQKKSDNVREKVIAAVGPDYTIGSDKSEQARVWIRSWLEGFAEDPGKQVLTIEQTATEWRSGTGDEISIFYFGREATSRGPGGGSNKVTVAWQGEQLVTEERAAKGKGRIRAVHTMLPGGSELQVDWRLEHESLRAPLEARLVFERAKPAQ
jgi:hypothetical protein